jgi:phage tail-like protein
MAEYPLPKFHFEVQWGGSIIGFTEISGLTVETDVIEFRDGASREYHKVKMPGMQKFGNITMKRGTFKGNNDFFNWWNTVALNTIDRRDVTISLLNEEHEAVVTWKIKNAWPTKVQATDLKSDDNGVAIETIELAHEGLVIQNE